uniref:Uncharacterized protein n=1 Tax=Trichogramma kaykai TaxID=54128 RepID=A0ABD2X062_9HYME
MDLQPSTQQSEEAPQSNADGTNGTEPPVNNQEVELEPPAELDHINTGLLEYLHRTTEGKVILKHYEKCSSMQPPQPMDKNVRSKLARLVIKREKDFVVKKISADEILEKFIITKDRFMILANEIERIFQRENASTYFVPFHQEGKEVTQQSGKLHYHFGYLKDSMKEDGLLMRKEIIDIDQPIISSTDEEKILWLSENVDPWTEVEEYWRDTLIIRRDLFLRNPDFTVHAYFEKFKCLSMQQGKELQTRSKSTTLLLFLSMVMISGVYSTS